MTYIDPWSKVLKFPEIVSRIQHGERVYPVNIEVDLSNRCNSKCSWCAFAYTHDGALLPYDLATRIIGECADVGVKALTFTGGGEPTTHPRFAEICKTAHEAGLKVGLYTNGMLRQPLLDAAPYLTWAYFSLDEATPKQYHASKGVHKFWTVLENVCALIGKTTVGMGFILHEGNYRQAPRMVELARGYGADYCQLRPIVGAADYSWLPECVEILHELDDPFVYVSYQRFAQVDRAERCYEECRGSELVPCIGATGELWVCPNTRGLRSLGNLHHATLKELWDRRERQMVGNDCRAVCRNHALNETLEYICSASPHMEFV
jgi:MoaA/NifB/PqqE/SkfB family radical SAM enzyme